MENMPLPSLAACLQATTWRRLLLIAESHGLSSSTRWSKAQLIETLHQQLLQPFTITTIIPHQSVAVQTLLAMLLRINGAALAQTLMATYGEVRPSSNWHKGLAQVYLQASPMERLFALGLLYFDPPHPKPGVIQRIVLPAELLPMLQSLVPTNLGPGASRSTPATSTLLTRPGQPPDLAWHMALWLATTAAEPSRCWRGGWLPPTALARLNARMSLGYTKVALRSERKLPYLAFLHYLSRAAGFTTAQEILALTPQAWQWLSTSSASRWQALWQAWCQAPTELTYPFHHSILARGAACFTWPALTPATRADLCAKVGQLSLDTFIPITQLVERIMLDDRYGQWGSEGDATEWGIAALCAGPLCWFGVLDLVTSEAGEVGRVGERETGRQGDEEETDLAFSDTSALDPAIQNLAIRLTPHGAWLLGLPDWGMPNFSKPTLCKAPAKEPDVIWVSPTIQPLHLARLASLCEWSAPATMTVDQRLQLDAARIGQAVAKGMQPAQIFQILTEATGAPPSQRQSQRLRSWIQAGQAVRIRPLIVLETIDAKLMGQLRSRKLVRRQLEPVLSPTRAAIHPEGLAALQQTLRTLGFYTQAPADFAAGPTPAAPETASAQDGADAGLLWLLVQVYQGLGAHTDLPVHLPAALLEAMHAQLTGAQQAAAESAAQQLLAQVAAGMQGYLRLPAWRMVAQGGKVLPRIEKALADHQDLQITYWGAGDEEKSVRRITPYWLETRQGVRYLIAYCHLREAERVFRIDRIEACEGVMADGGEVRSEEMK